MEWRFAETVRDSIREASARLNIWHGPVRSGKTIASIVAWLLFIRTAPPGALLMVGKTERTLKRNILDVIAQIAGTKNYRYVGGSGEAFIYGRRVLLVGANDERAEGKIRGLTVAGAYGDELSLWPEGFFRQLLARMSVRGARFFGTTNPDGPYHWLKVNFLDRVGELDLRAFTWPLEHNVALDPAYVASLKAEYGEGSLWYRRFIEGLWVAAEGAVYDFFNESEHVIAGLGVEPERLALSVDYGTSNATSAGLYGLWSKPTPTGLRAARLDGYYYDGRATGRQKTDSEYAADLDEKFGSLKPKLQVILDPSAASFKAELKKNGWKVRDAKNDVIDGIRTQAKMLRSGEYKLLDAPGNKQAIRDYGAYLWDSKAQARGEDKPLKQHDHCFVAGTLVHTQRGQVPIEQVTTADRVLTRAGYRQVLKAGLTQKQVPVLRVEFSNRAALVGTPNHPIFVQGRGFVRMDELRYADDIIAVWDDAPSRSSIVGESIGVTPIPLTRALGGTSEGQPTPATFTDTFGKMLTALSRMASRFTTWTATLATTPLATSRAYLSAGTSAITPAAGRSPPSTIRRCSRALPSGTDRLLGLSGTHGTPSATGGQLKPEAPNAPIAAANTRRDNSAESPLSARTPARARLDGSRESTTRLEHALTVDVSSPPTATARLGIVHVLAEPQPFGRADVYDLTVDGLPEFVANGILVHNSKDEERYLLHTFFGQYRPTSDDRTAMHKSLRRMA